LTNSPGQNKYYDRSGIVNKTFDHRNDSVGWISISDKERIDEYTRIDSVIYCGEIACDIEPMTGIDISSFEVLPGTNYARDKDNVYYPIQIICVDYVDCGVCYCSKYILDNVNRETFVYLDKEYATDGKNVYFRGELIKGADGETFKVIDGPEYFYFAVDNNTVYIHNITFSSADPATFYFDRDDERNIDTDYEHKYIIGDKNNEWEFIPPSTINRVKKK
jgi:hypothetical protein